MIFSAIAVLATYIIQTTCFAKSAQIIGSRIGRKD